MLKIYQTLPVFLFFLFNQILQAQVYNIDDVDGTTVRSCAGTFFDSGGENDRYSNREDYRVTFCASGGNAGKSARLTFRELDLRDFDVLTFYDGPDISFPLLEIIDRGTNDVVPFSVSATRNNASGCITLEFTSRRFLFVSSEGEGWRAEVGCIDRCQVIQTELVSSNPAVMPADTGWIDACIGQEITFEGRGIFPQEGQFYSHENSSEYFWDFGDGTRATGRNVSHTYTEPGGYLVQFTIVDQLGCISINNLDQRVRISPPPNFSIQDTPQSCAGDTLSLFGSINNNTAGGIVNADEVGGIFQPRYQRADSLFLPDGKGVAYETSVNITQFSPGQTLEDINDLLGICVNIEHSYMRDLQVSIECPNGTEVIMQNFENKDRAGSIFLGEPIDVESNLAPGLGYIYCWTPNATNPTWIDYGRNVLNGGGTLPAGDYTSFSSLDSLIGCPLNGAWTITVEDYLLRDNGYIFDWSIEFNPDLYPALEEFNPAIVDFGWLPSDNTVSVGDGSIDAALNSAGENAYTFYTTDEFGCTYDTTVIVKALPPTHPDCYSCQELLTETEDITYCDEEPASLNVGASDLNQNVQFDAFPNYSNLNGATHSNTTPFESIIDVNSIFPATIGDLSDIISICIDLESNTGDPDLSIALEAPNGRILQLSSNNGSNYRQTCFTPTATTNIQAGTVPFTGNFAPEGSFNSLLSSNINGDWKLLVSSNSGTINSTVKHWSITFRSQNEITYDWLPSAGLSCADCPTPDLISTGEAFQTYIVEASDQYNCLDRDTIAITNISNIDVPNITCEVTDNKALSIGWDDMDATEYEISLNGSNWFNPDFANNHLLNGLGRDEAVNISLRPILNGIPVICTIPTSDTVCIYIGCELELQMTDALLAVSCFDSQDATAAFLWQDGIAPFNYSFNSNNSSTNDTTYQAENLTPGDYQFVINDSEACSDTIVFQITAPSQLELSMNLQNPNCADDRNGQIEVEVNGGTPSYSYSMDGVLFDKDAVFTGLQAGTYEIIVQDANGCELQQQAVLENPASLSVSIAREDEEYIQMTYGDDYQLFANLKNEQGFVDYRWTSISNDSTLSCSDCPNPFIQPLSTTYYEVEVIDENGCKGSDRVQVRVERIFKFYVPNIFSPNEDGDNDFLTVYSESSAIVRSFQVFDRWGGLIFSRTNFAANEEFDGWDGKANGRKMPEGTYVWFAEIEYNDGTKKMFEGGTDLVR